MKHITKEEYFGKLTPDKLTISELPNTIGEAYINGIEEAEEKFRNAIKIALKETNTPVTPFFNIILNEINK